MYYLVPGGRMNINYQISAIIQEKVCPKLVKGILALNFNIALYEESQVIVVKNDDSFMIITTVMSI